MTKTVGGGGFFDCLTKGCDLCADCGCKQCVIVCAPTPKVKVENTVAGQLALALDQKDPEKFEDILSKQPHHEQDTLLASSPEGVVAVKAPNKFPNTTGRFCWDIRSSKWARWWFALYYLSWIFVIPGIPFYISVGAYNSGEYYGTTRLEKRFGYSSSYDVRNAPYSPFKNSMSNGFSRSNGCDNDNGDTNLCVAMADFWFLIWILVSVFNLISLININGTHYWFVIFKWPHEMATTHTLGEGGGYTLKDVDGGGEAGDTLMDRARALATWMKEESTRILTTSKGLVTLLDSGKERRRESFEERKLEKTDALEGASEIVQQDAIKYRLGFKKLLDANDGQARKDRIPFDEAATDMKTAIDSQSYKIEQPEVGGVDHMKQKGKFVRGISKQIGSKMADVDAKLKHIASTSDASLKIGEDKSDERLFEKARLSYKGNLRRVTDYCRRSIVCQNFVQLLAILLAINMEFTIVRLKNRFAKDNEVAKATGAYRDCQLNLYIPGTKLIVELQLHLQVIYDLKAKVADQEDADGRNGHDRYIEFRLLKETADHEFADLEFGFGEAAI